MYRSLCKSCHLLLCHTSCWCHASLPGRILSLKYCISYPSIHPPPALTSGLSTWSTATNPQATAFHSHAPWLISFDQIQGATNPVHDFVNTHALRTLCNLTQAHKRQHYASFSASAPPFLAPVLSFIMVHHTSEALLNTWQVPCTGGALCDILLIALTYCRESSICFIHTWISIFVHSSKLFCTSWCIKHDHKMVVFLLHPNDFW
jgi:hypothetical protein